MGKPYLSWKQVRVHKRHRAIENEPQQIALDECMHGKVDDNDRGHTKMQVIPSQVLSLKRPH